eukprot:1391795-Amorphochlora_amoeboformis.AAC.2
MNEVAYFIHVRSTFPGILVDCMHGLIKVFSSLSIPVVTVATRLKLTEGHSWSSSISGIR